MLRLDRRNICSVVTAMLFAPGVASIHGQESEDDSLRFSLSEVEVGAGETFEVPFHVEADAPLSMISFSLEFDEETLEFIAPLVTPLTRELLDRHTGGDTLFVWFAEEGEEDDDEEDRGEACLTGADPGADPRGRIKLKQKDDGRTELRIDVKSLAPESFYDVTLASEDGPDGWLGRVETKPKGDGRLTLFDDTIESLGVASFVDLSGSDVIVADADGTEILRGEIPRLGDDVECDEDHDDKPKRWLQVLLVLDAEGREAFSLPAGRVTPLHLKFRMRGDVPPGNRRLKFSKPEDASYEGNFFDGETAVFNAARRHGNPFPRERPFDGSSRPRVDDGAVIVASIIGDVGVFSRGDVNVDEAVDIADAVGILHHLFLGTPLRCLGAADANGDGAVDISDTLVILGYLFLGETSWSPSTFRSSSTTGESQTPGGLECS